ncbi:MAG: YggT family protein [Clostridia bacterium]|nr:YggT family protein [Clostridia bacterium]
MIFVYYLAHIITIILSLFELCMFVRAICSWVPQFRDSMVYGISFKVTEPVLYPIRKWLFRFNWVRNCPIDISFIVVIILINGFSSLLTFFMYL